MGYYLLTLVGLSIAVGLGAYVAKRLAWWLSAMAVTYRRAALSTFSAYAVAVPLSQSLWSFHVFRESRLSVSLIRLVLLWGGVAFAHLIFLRGEDGKRLSLGAGFLISTGQLVLVFPAMSLGMMVFVWMMGLVS
ncbi:MAG: hypothetical protein RLZZ244_1688 [Verrucomicrobiota bacterium]|jgi:hypothetical protein